MKFRSTLLTAPLFILAGCASLPANVRDSDALDPTSAYILLSTCYSFGSQNFDEIDVELLSLPREGSPTKVFLPKTPNNTRVIVKVPPGIYYLNYLRALDGYYQAQINGRLTLFEARAGRLNYPGEWLVGSTVHSVSVEGNIVDGGSSSISYTMHVSVQPDDSVQEFVKRKYPTLSARLPLVYTKLSAAKVE